MNKFGNRPKLKEFRWTSNAAKVFLATASALSALCAIVVICLIAFGASRPKKVGANGSVAAPLLSAQKVSPATPAEKGNGNAASLPDTNQPIQGTIAAQHPVSAQTPTPSLSPIPTPGPVPQPESKAFVSDSELLRGGQPDFVPENRERKLPRSVRKNLEKERREAERKRSRLEDMYQKHLISSEAYKEGEKEYRNQIEKYRSELNAGSSLPNSLE